MQPEMQREAEDIPKCLPRHDPGHPSGGTAPEGRLYAAHATRATRCVAGVFLLGKPLRNGFRR